MREQDARKFIRVISLNLPLWFQAKAEDEILDKNTTSSSSASSLKLKKEKDGEEEQKKKKEENKKEK